MIITKFKRTAHCVRTKNDKPVQSGLAMSPSKMDELVRKGLPISTQNMDMMFYDGEANPGNFVPLDRMRGVDVNDMWNFQQGLQKKTKQAYKNAKQQLNNITKTEE